MSTALIEAQFSRLRLCTLSLLSRESVSNNKHKIGANTNDIHLDLPIRRIAPTTPPKPMSLAIRTTGNHFA